MKIAITTGDVNGIGAEITIKALNLLGLPSDNIVLISNQKVLDFYGKLDENYQIVEIDYDGQIEVGKITAQSGDFSYRALEKACELVKTGEIKAIVTAPVSKEAMQMAEHNFNGQTEVLEQFLAHDGQKAEMLFVAGDFRVLLLTRHVALKDVKLNKDEVINKIIELNTNLLRFARGKSLKFALCGLNPHAGENGILGSEEVDILIPAVEELRTKGIDITYPKPADTLFVEACKNYSNGQKPPYDCYIACYHDQGLIPIKAVALEKCVNTTIGLDIVRTSPAHGTAFDIAGKSLANHYSMAEAIKAVL